MIYIESAWNDGYIAHHAKDMIYIVIVHRPEDGYLLTADKQVIKERLELKEFLIRLMQAERKVNWISIKDIDNQMLEIQHNLRLGQHREVATWLDHRYARLIRNKELILAQHHYDAEFDKAFNRLGEIEERETISNKQREITQEWNQRLFQAEMERQELKIQHPMTTDESYRVSDKDIYYSITS